jgi:hypothetical protein
MSLYSKFNLRITELSLISTSAKRYLVIVVDKLSDGAYLQNSTTPRKKAAYNGRHEFISVYASSGFLGNTTGCHSLYID